MVRTEIKLSKLHEEAQASLPSVFLTIVIMKICFSNCLWWKTSVFLFFQKFQSIMERCFLKRKLVYQQTGELIKKTWYYSAIRKNERFPFVTTQMDTEGIRLSEINQRETNTVWYHLYVEPKKYNKLVNITKQKQTHRFWEQISGYQWGCGRGSIGAQDLKRELLWDYMKLCLWNLWKL